MSALFRIFITLPAIVLWSLASDSQAQVYRFPPSPGARMLTEPKVKISGSRSVRVWNFFGQGGTASANIIEFKSTAQGLRRIPQEICHVVYGSATQSMDTTALLAMFSDGYIDSDGVTHYLTATDRLESQQLVYLESIARLHPSDLLGAFGGQIPWDRIAEVEGPPGLETVSVKAAVEQGSSDFVVVLRLATLRLVYGQSMEWGTRHQNYPYEVPAETAFDFWVNRNKFPFIFDLGRASQVRAFAGEALELSKIALSLALQQTLLFPTWGHPYFPPDSALVLLETLDLRHRRLFERVLGVRQRRHRQERSSHGDREHSVLQGTLAELLEREPITRIHPLLGKIRELLKVNAPKGATNEELEIRSMQALMLYRTTYRVDFDFSEQQEAIVMRDQSKYFRIRLESIFGPLFGDQLGELLTLLNGEARLSSKVDPPGFYQNDVHGVEWRERYGIEPIAFSNFTDTTKVPDYATQFLLALYQKFQFDASLAPPLIFAVSPREMELIHQFRKLGLHELTPLENGINVFRWTWGELKAWVQLHPRVGARKPSLEQKGYWHFFRTLFDLPGI